MLSFRGGAKDDDEEAEEDEDENENDDEAEAEEDEEDDETDGDASEDEYYDDEEESEEEEEEEESSLASGLKKKSKSKTPSGEIVEPYFVSPSLQMYTTFGTILLSRKVDMFNPTVVRLCRYVPCCFAKTARCMIVVSCVYVCERIYRTKSRRFACLLSFAPNN